MLNEGVKKIGIKRVKKGERGSKTLEPDGFTHGVYPADGFLIFEKQFKTIPFFVRDTDLEKARNMRKVDETASIDALSWEE